MKNLKIVCSILIILFVMVSIGFIGSSKAKASDKKRQQKFSVPGYSAKVDGNILIVESPNQIRIYDLKRKKQIKVLTIPEKSWVYGLDISDNNVVWADTRNEKEKIQISDGTHDVYNLNSDIFTYNIKTGEQKQITDSLSSQASPKLWKNYLVYKDNRDDETKEYPGKWNLYLYNLNTGIEQLIIPNISAYSSYSIMDNKIVWEDDSNFRGPDNLRGAGNVPENNKDIYLYNIATQKKTAIATGKYMESNPSVGGNYIVYEDRNNGSLNADIILYNILTKKKINITHDKFNQGNPCIYGDYVVWMDERNGISTNDVIINGKLPNSDIYIYNIKTKKETKLTGKEPQIMPSISSDWVTYITSRQINPIVESITYK